MLMLSCVKELQLTCFLALLLKWRGNAINVRNMYTFKGIETPHKGHNMVIFVLDKTIWPFQMDSVNKSIADLNEIRESHLGGLNIFPETHACLDALQKLGFVLAAIYSCKTPRLGENLLDAFDLTRYFAYQVCSEKEKLSPVVTLHTQSGVDFEDMLYFDYDLRDNLPLIEYNVTFCPIDDQGITMAAVEKSIEIFAVRTTLIPPLITTHRQKNVNDSSEYSWAIDYKHVDFVKPKTEEFLSELGTDEDSYE